MQLILCHLFIRGKRWKMPLIIVCLTFLLLILSIPFKMSTFFGNSGHPFPEKQCIPFRSRVQVSINTQMESLFHALSEVTVTDRYSLEGVGFQSNYHGTVHQLPLIRGGLIHDPST